MKTNNHYHLEDKRYYLPTFNRYPLALVKGKGSRVWDIEGNEYIDVLAGIAVNVVGHCHPHVAEAIKLQAETLIHISNFYISEPQLKLSEKLVRLSGLDRVFFTNSGAESSEGAVKIARKYAHSHKRGGEVISMEKAFHGRTLATIAMGSETHQKGFEPIPAGFKKVPFNDLGALEKAISIDTAAVVLEPVQGEGGIHPVNREYLEEVRALCNENDIVLIFDEIQCGMGRTGKYFAKDHYGVQPDIITLAKGLGGGVPIGAVLASEKVSEVMEYGDHGTTFGGNPLVCAAALATIEVIEKEGLLQEAIEKGEWLRNKIKALHNPHIKDIRGLGLMLGVEFDFEVKPLVKLLIEKGVLANATAGNVFRLVPPLNISYEDLETAVNRLEEVLKDYKVNG